jgi:hypothetical protein
VKPEVDNSKTGMDLRDLVADPDFPRREKQKRDPAREVDAFGRLAHVFAENSETILQELVNLAVQLCGADSAGISLEELADPENPKFRWVAIAGSFSHFLYGTTPRFFSPCGTCLNRGVPQLYRVTKPYYDYLGIEAAPISDGILIPWTSGGMRGTLWAVAHNSAEAFDFEDYRLLKGLADFAAIAIRHQAQQKALQKQENLAATIAMANDLAHQINNPLQCLTNTVYLAARGHADTQTFLKQAAEELDRLALLVKQLLSVQGMQDTTSDESIPSVTE